MERRLWRQDICRWLSSLYLLPHRVRPRLLNWAGDSVHNRVSLRPPITIVGRSKLSIDCDSFINAHTYIDLAAPISIGKNVSIGPGVSLITSSHSLGDGSRRAGPWTKHPIVLEEGSWLGARCVVLPGVRIRRGTVVAAGSVVTASTEEDSMYAGVPAEKKRTYQTFDKK